MLVATVLYGCMMMVVAHIANVQFIHKVLIKGYLILLRYILATDDGRTRKNTLNISFFKTILCLCRGKRHIS